MYTPHNTLNILHFFKQVTLTNLGILYNISDYCSYNLSYLFIRHSGKNVMLTTHIGNVSLSFSK